MAYQIIVHYPNGQQLNFKFEQDTVYFGRLEGNDIRLAHSYVSGRHFMVQQRGSSFFVSDVGSTNGTLVNGQLIEAQTPQPLGLGDVIQVGPLEIRVEPIVEATVIEKTPSRLMPTTGAAAAAAGPRPGGPAPIPPSPSTPSGIAARTQFEDVPPDAPSPMWKIQTGMFRAQGDVVRVDDQAVPAPRGEMVAAGPRPDLERLLRAAPALEVEPGLPAASLRSTASGPLLQAFGLALVACCLALLIAVILL
jgi:predicted component of type VI protein secretion system